MVTIGVDAHKTVHHAVALTPDGTILGQWRGATTPTHWKALATWAEQFPGPRQWGIEGAWNYGRGLAQFLVASGELVFEVNPRWTADRRRRARKTDKSDHLMPMRSLNWFAMSQRPCLRSLPRTPRACWTCW